MSHRILSALVLAVVATAVPSAASAQPTPPVEPVPPGDPVQAHVDRAMALYEAADLAGAMQELTAAYAMSPRADLLWAMGRIHVERGECAEAIDAYRRFLASDPGPSSTEIATEAIATCQRVLAASGVAPPADAAPEPGPSPPPEPGPVAASPPPAPRTRVKPWYTDTLGDTLVGAGALGGAGAVVLMLSARRDLARADEGAAGGVPLAEHTRLTDRADIKQRWAAVAGGVGAALVVGGVVRFLTGDRREVVVVTAAGSDRGVALTVHGRF
jgi:hypothetical protein